MSKPSSCGQIEPDLIAAATGEESERAAARVQAHVSGCRPCRVDFAR